MVRWMINCQEHSRLTSESMDRALSFWDRLSVGMHRLICPPCKRLKQQFDAIRKACRTIPMESEALREAMKDAIVMPKDARQKMISVLKEHLK